MQVPPFFSSTSLTRVLILVPVPHSAEQLPTTQLSHSQWTAETEMWFIKIDNSYALTNNAFDLPNEILYIMYLDMCRKALDTLFG